MIIVLDCNIWISLALNQQLDFISSLQKSKITIAACKDLQDELANVMSRPKFKKYFSKSYIEKFIQFYKINTTPFEIFDVEKVVADEKDDYLFALSKITGADYFVTGDKLLLIVNNYQGTEVLSLNEFKKRLNKI